MTAELPAGFWSGWIVVLTVFSLAGLVWLTVSVYFADDAPRGDRPEPVWDEELEEGANAPPMWWFWMLFGSLIVSVAYLMLFPGLGGYPGLLDWSQGARLAGSYEAYERSFQRRRDEIAVMELAGIQNDPALMATAERIFRRECAACHGPEGRGQAALFPNLHDVDWQWGSAPERIEQSIRDGRRAVMAGFAPALGDEGVDQVTDYVLRLGGGGTDGHPGKAAYDGNCAVCHGADGAGSELLGAPRLSDGIWLYGGDPRTVRATIADGRFGVMPAFGGRLDDAQIRLLVALLAR